MQNFNLDELTYEQYHKHSYWSNLCMRDSVEKPEDYAKRAVELGQSTLSSVEHGSAGYYIETYEFAEKYNLKFLFGAEVYFVIEDYIDAETRDKTNAHMILLAKNENGRRAINRIVSKANIEQFYYRARVTLKDVLSLPCDDVWITTACLAGVWKYQSKSIDIVKQLKNHFKENFFLEVQYHTNISQKELNKKILIISKALNVPIIMGCDSHYIKSEDSWKRDDFLKANGITYDEEDSWYMDYPTVKQCINRFHEQNVLNDEQIYEAINNTNIFKQVQKYESDIFNKEIKMPTLYPELSQSDKDKKFVEVIKDKWEIRKNNVPKEKWDMYQDEIKKEVQSVIDTHMSDYFLFNYEMVKKGIENGGVITPSGRGCFTKDALIVTNNSLKTINNVNIGDMVIGEDGKFHKVIDTMNYDIDEELVQITHMCGTNKYYPAICTQDHKILIHRNNKNEYIEAKNILNSDYVCCPKLTFENKSNDIIDLNDYNIFGFKYDNDYIYEHSSYRKNESYPYCPKDIAKSIGCGRSVIEKIANGNYKNSFKRKKYLKGRFFECVPFNTYDEYFDYIKEQRLVKINRYIANDIIYNQFIGLMYGDGWNRGKENVIGLAINSISQKDEINRKIFEKIAERIGVKVYENKSLKKNLIQISFTSKIFSEYFSQYFESKKGREKIFNENLFYQSKEKLEAIRYGLFLSDGSDKEERVSFDNTSKSIINAYKILSQTTQEFGVCSLATRPSWTTKEGWVCKESYKLRYNSKPYDAYKSKDRAIRDENYWYLPVYEIKNIGKQNTTVYDLTVEDSHSFLINNMIVHNSGVSFYINNLLGFTKIDRINSPVTMFPERFMSTTRILETKSLPDIDNNVSVQKPFEDACVELLGEEHVVLMCSFGTMKPKNAWKMYSRANDIDFEISNIVSEQIDKYELALKYHDEDDDENVPDVLDYIGEQYQDIFNKSKEYLGIISEGKRSPCSLLLYGGNISEEIGLIRFKNNICCIADGHWAEEYKFLKEDILKVASVELIYSIFKRIGIEPFDVNELLDFVNSDDKTWDIYKKGLVQGINQVEKDATRTKVMRYQPQNISELSAFIAGIRPSFKSMYKTFENREPFLYNIDIFDKLIQTSEMPYSFLFYQEQIMKTLNYAGISMSETYDIIKFISKKKYDKIMKYKEQFLSGFSDKIINDDAKFDVDIAKDLSGKIWTIIIDSASYMFNASHSYSMSIDSVYLAYLKSHYPLEFYEVFLNQLMSRTEKDRASKTKQEAYDGYGIKIEQFRFRQDNRQFTIIPNQNAISDSLKAIKGFGDNVAEELYELRNEKYDSFIDLLDVLKNETKVNESQIETLIVLKYFEEFGKNKKLLGIWEYYKKIRTLKQINKDKVDTLGVPIDLFIGYVGKETEKLYKDINTNGLLNKICDLLDDEPLNVKMQTIREVNLLGFVKTTNDDIPNDWFFVQEIKVFKNPFKPYLTLYNLKEGYVISSKIKKDEVYIEQPFKEGSIIRAIDFQRKHKMRKVDDKWIQSDEEEMIIESYDLLI